MKKLILFLVGFVSLSSFSLHSAPSPQSGEVSTKQLLAGLWSILQIRGIASCFTSIANYISGPSLTDIRAQLRAEYEQGLELAARWERVKSIVKKRDMEADFKRELEKAKSISAEFQARLKELETNQQTLVGSVSANSQSLAQHKKEMAKAPQLARQRFEQEKRRIAIISRPGPILKSLGAQTNFELTAEDAARLLEIGLQN